ncbi:MAG: response regulator transcription factor [Gemmatimonadota bacterium]
MTVAARPTVVVADDYPLVSKTLLRMVAQRFNGVEAVQCLETLATALEEHQPDIALVDVRMQEETSTLDVLPQLMEISSATRFILITGFPDWAPAGRLFALGARGLLAKPFVPKELWRAIDVVHSGGSYLSESPLMRDGTRVLRPLKQLSETQAKVFALLRQGLSYAQIEERIGPKESTIGKHVRFVREKLGIATEPGYVRWEHIVCPCMDRLEDRFPRGPSSAR